MSEPCGIASGSCADEIRWQFIPSRDLAGLSGAWNDIASRVNAPPCLSARFVSAALHEFSGPPKWMVSGTVGNRVAVAGILQKVGPAQWATYQPSQLPLGAWLMEPGLPWEATLGSLIRKLPSLGLTCSISQQDPALIPRPQSTRRLRAADYIRTSYIDVGGEFADFWGSRGKNLRQNSKKQRKKLSEKGFDPRLEIVADGAGVGRAIDEFIRLESSSWKRSTGSAVTDDSEQGRFYRRMMSDHVARGCGFVALWYAGNQVAAADLCIQDHGQVVILKTTYDESLQGVSPGQLMHEELFQYLFDVAKVARIEFLGRAMEWHQRWTEQERTLYHVTYFRSPIIRGLRDVLRRRARAEAPEGSA